MTPRPAARPPLDRALLEGQTDLVPEVSIEVLDRAPSTNAVVADRAREGAPEGLVVVADEQTAGRGRLDRGWRTPPGTAVTFSLLVRPVAPTRSWPWLPLLTGYAVAKAVTARGIEAGVKWPNDVLVGERKLAGILVERIETGQGPAAVIGVGLNTGFTAEELPVPHATSLAVESGVQPDRTEVLVEVLSAVKEAYDAWQAGGDLTGMRLADSYAASCVTLGRTVRVALPDGTDLVGRAVEIDPSGRLVVETPSGRQPVGAGDVVHVRDAEPPE